MGKKSLIKSTDKTKSKPKKKESAAKKTTPKKSAATAKKTTKKAAATKKTTTKKTTAKKSVKKAAKKVTMKELIFKKFEPLSKQPAPEPAAKAKSTVPHAPEIITSDDPQERKRLRALLMAKYSMEDIKASAKAPEPIKTTDEKPEPAAVEPAASPKAATPEATPAEVPEDDSVEAAAAIAAAAKPVQPEKTAPPKPTRAPLPSFDSTGPESDPVQKVLKYGVVVFVVLILLLVGASYKNSNNYYIVNKGDAVEIWRGRFSPTGKERLILLHGVSAPEGRGTVYTRNHVFPLAFNYYLEKADALLDTERIPDYEGIREYLQKAKAFAINDAMKDDITARLNDIDLITLIYKIDVSLRRNTNESLDLAAQLIKKAGKLTTNAAQGQLLADKAAEIKERRAALAAAEKETEAAETQEAVSTEEPSSPEK
jgi:hypothetical protein